MATGPNTVVYRPNLIDGVESGLGHEPGEPAGDVVARAFQVSQYPSLETGDHRPWGGEIQDDQLTAAGEDAAGLNEGVQLAGAVQVVDDQAGEDPIEVGVREGKVPREAQLPGDARSGRLAGCRGQHVLVAVQPGEARTGVGPLGHDGQRSRAAPQVEHAHARADAGVLG